MCWQRATAIEIAVRSTEEATPPEPALLLNLLLLNQVLETAVRSTEEEECVFSLHPTPYQVASLEATAALESAVRSTEEAAAAARATQVLLFFFITSE